jgi:hypothetical protein
MSTFSQQRSKPERIIVGFLGFDRFEGCVGGIHESKDVCEEVTHDVQED